MGVHLDGQFELLEAIRMVNYAQTLQGGAVVVSQLGGSSWDTFQDRADEHQGRLAVLLYLLVASVVATLVT
jgi:hypothetical protein